MKKAGHHRKGGAKFKPQYKRLLFIDRKIREGKYPNCTKLAEEWQGISYKTIQRDIDYLKYELDAPIEYDYVHKGFYYADKTWFLPSLLLSEGELMALLIGTQALNMYKGTPVAGTLQEIYGKLAALLPDKITLAPEFVYDHMSFISDDVWKAIIRGLMHQRVMEIDYQSPKSSAVKHHEIHPLHLVNIEGDWYLLARNPRFEDVTQYAVSRIKGAVAREEQFKAPTGFNAQEVLKNRFGKFIHHEGKKVDVRLRFDAKLASFVEEKVWHPEQKIRPCKDGGVELTIPVNEPETLLPWILSFGSNVCVLAPAKLKASIRTEAEVIAKLHSSISANTRALI